MSEPQATPELKRQPTPPVSVSETEWRMIRDILQRHVPDCSVWAFGSRVAGNPRPFSDLDLAIEGEGPLPLERMDALREAFRESPLPWKVDIVDLANVSDTFRRLIAPSMRLLQEKAS